MSARAVFVDRDGVLNATLVRDGVPQPPAGTADVEILPGVREALDDLASRGYLVIGVTNQPDVARGRQSQGVVAAINQSLLAQLPLAEILTCLHDDADECSCRKPRPGMLLDAARRFGVDLGRSSMVGDRWRDIEAGRAAGCRTLLIGRPYSQRERCQPDHVVADLREAASVIIAAEAASDEVQPALARLRVRIFADGADIASMRRLAGLSYVEGFTTNPTLMRKAGVADYLAFAREAVSTLPDRPISFEVISDGFEEMERQALRISGLGENVFVKIPVTNTHGVSSLPLIRRLATAGIKLNVTALLTLDQVRQVSAALGGGAPSFVSVFAGRIADTGRDPIPIMAEAVNVLGAHPSQRLIWASPREVLNVLQADAVGCHVITMTEDLMRKLALIGKDLRELSLDTVRMFRDDALKAGYSL